MAVLCGESVVRRGRDVAEIVGVGDPAGEGQHIAFPEGIRPHFGRDEQIPAPARAFQPALAEKRADHVIGRLRADAQHVDDFLALHFLAAVFRPESGRRGFLGATAIACRLTLSRPARNFLNNCVSMQEISGTGTKVDYALRHEARFSKRGMVRGARRGGRSRWRPLGWLGRRRLGAAAGLVVGTAFHGTSDNPLIYRI